MKKLGNGPLGGIPGKAEQEGSFLASLWKVKCNCTSMRGPVFASGRVLPLFVHSRGIWRAFLCLLDPHPVGFYGSAVVDQIQDETRHGRRSDLGGPLKEDSLVGRSFVQLMLFTNRWNTGKLMFKGLLGS